MIKFSELKQLVGGDLVRFFKDRPLKTLVIDSRKAIASPEALFFAISGPRHNGHQFIPSLYSMGFRQFIVEESGDYYDYPEANIIRVASSVKALQNIVAHHRARFKIPVIGITGSNGKTIIKEWLFQLFSSNLNIVKNPGSYNSQTGVPLSVWQMDDHHQLGIFEAGISQPGEMVLLEKVIRPTIGIFTNAGTAHDEGFSSTDEKIREKLLLFEDVEVLIYSDNQRAVAEKITSKFHHDKTLLSWGSNIASDIKIEKTEDRKFSIQWKEFNFVIELPFSDLASIENACHCIAVMLWFKFSPEFIREKMMRLQTIPMRLELKQGINGCQIIDDTYNNDLAGLQISLDFLTGIQNKKSILILSDILQSGLSDEVLAQSVAKIIVQAKVSSMIGIGLVMTKNRKIFEALLPCSFYESTEEFITQTNFNEFHQEVILVKGARPFQFEKIIKRLVHKIHGTVMEIDLGRMVHNLNFFRSKLEQGVKLMVMVKAFAYGSGSEEVANLLQYHGIDYLGVAYPDEGVDLRKNKIRLPIMVMNPSEESFETIFENDLEPEIYNLSLLKSFVLFLKGRSHKIHLKIDTGMHRLGFEVEDIDEVLTILKGQHNLIIASIFSHLAGADDEVHDEFTHVQVKRFLSVANRLKHELGINPICHILNSSGILRFKEYQFDMVRLGIGLYGINPTASKEEQLHPVATLKTVISQVKKIRQGDTIGYGRQGKAEKEMTIATIAIGYADGFSRGFSKGVGEVSMSGQRAPVLGNVCMDMTMIDVTNLQAKEGDEVIIFGPGLPISELAKKINTIPYEILTGTSERVKRVFYAESI